MTSNDILQRVKDITVSSNAYDTLKIPIDELAFQLNLKRTDLISYLVDLKIAGYIEFDRNTLHLSEPVHVRQ